jgi:L-threonylcarbamoyladenylate synthase
MTRMLELDAANPNPASIAEAAALICAGKLVAFPTETVYGLGANALDAAAVAGIFVAKGRPATNPLIVHVADALMARQLVTAWPEVAQQLADALWPGPLTLVLPKHSSVPDCVTAGLPAVGVRVPAHPVALALIRAAGRPIAAPSANPYMGVSPTTAQHVLAGLAGGVDLILDGGPATVGLESTVLDLTRGVPTVLRLGGVSLASLRALLPEVDFAPQVADDEVARVSPGLARRHYAPRAHVHLVAGTEAAWELATRLLSNGEGPLGVWLATDQRPAVEGLKIVLMPAQPAAFAARLYAELHQADAQGWRHLVVALPSEVEAWAAVRDRLERAATDHPRS